MFAVRYFDWHYFCHNDPSADGYEGQVNPVDELDYDLDAISKWPIGSDAPDPWLGVKRSHPRHFKVFRSRPECEDAGYFPMGTQFAVLNSWKDRPPLPDEIEEAQK